MATIILKTIRTSASLVKHRKNPAQRLGTAKKVHSWDDIIH